MDCVWFVTALPDGYVKAHFLKFDIEIRFDYFSLGFGHNSIGERARLLYLTGQWAPISVTSEDSRMWFRFTTDVSKSGRGIAISLSRLQYQGMTIDTTFI